MINPGYEYQIGERVKAIPSGPVISCPHCKRPLMEAVAERVKTRCKHCGKWVLIYKTRLDIAHIKK